MSDNIVRFPVIPRYVPDQASARLGLWIKAVLSSPDILKERNRAWLKRWMMESEEDCGLEFVVDELKAALARVEQVLKE